MRTFAFGIAAIALLAAAGCADEEPTSSQVGNTKVGGLDKTPWAVDMAKVDEHYGTSSSYFFGLAPSETGLPTEIPGGDQAVWDLTIKKNSDHTAHQDDGTDIAVIDRQGNKIDPTGYVNIIPMLPDTDPAEQVHIKKYLRDGDVLVYIHPEYTSPKDQMERRASHVAMHYEYETADGRELVHHIDNPNSYGPRYNHPANRHMPFHVFRYQPREDREYSVAGGGAAETVEGVAFTGAQRDGVLKLLNEEMSAEDKLEKLDVDLRLDRRAAENIVNALPIDSLEQLASIPYVAATALEKLRDAAGSEGGAGFTVSNKMAEAYGMAARNWGMMTNDLSPFADFFTLNLKQKDQIGGFATAAVNHQQMPSLYCSGLAYANLNLALNMPQNPNGLGDLWGTFSAGGYDFSDAGERLTAEQLRAPEELRSIDRLVFRPYAATDILTEWVDVNMATLPMPVRQQLLQQPDLQQLIVGGFSQLEWSDESSEKSQSGQFSPATLENVGRWARAYGQDASATEAFLAADTPLADAFDQLGIPRDGLTPMDVLQEVERATVETQFVPPRIWIDEADKLDSDMIYVGTVLNCELLIDPNDPSNDACAGAGDGASEFSEGGADTMTYPHYGVPNGGQRTHRRFDATPGPELMGHGSLMRVRATGMRDDLVFSAHLPEHWTEAQQLDISMIEFDQYCTAQGTTVGCAPNLGLYLDPATANGGEGAPAELRDWTGEWRLEDLCSWTEGDETMECQGVDTSSGAPASVAITASRKARGFVTITMYDRGDIPTGFDDDERCANCAAGGAQFNQAYVKIRND